MSGSFLAWRAFCFYSCRRHLSARGFPAWQPLLFSRRSLGMRQRSIILVMLGALASLGAAQQRTQNFLVHAPTPQIAQQIAHHAEHYRREKALVWLGREMPPWPQPCPLHVQVTMDGP